MTVAHSEEQDTGMMDLVEVRALCGNTIMSRFSHQKIIRKSRFVLRDSHMVCENGLTELNVACVCIEEISAYMCVCVHVYPHVCIVLIEASIFC